MNLPDIITPTYKVEFPQGNGKPSIPYRIRQMKIEEYLPLSQAFVHFQMMTEMLESGDENVSIDTSAKDDLILKIVKACVVDKEYNVEKEPYHKTHWLFLEIYKISKGTLQSAVVKCGGCGKQISLNIRLDDIKLTYPPEYREKVVVSLNDTTGFELALPSATVLRDLNLSLSKSLSKHKMFDEFIVRSITKIFQGDNISQVSINSEEEYQELYNWFTQLPVEVFLDITKFFKNLPIIELRQDIKCSNCGHAQQVVVKDFDSFLKF